MLELHLLKRKELSVDDSDFLRTAIQSMINARILDGYLIGCKWAIAYSSDTPLLKVANVEETGIYITFGIILTNDKESVEAVRKADNHMPKSAVNDADPLF